MQICNILCTFAFMTNDVLHYIDQIQSFLWTYIVVTMLVGCALYFTVRTRGVQFRLWSLSPGKKKHEGQSTMHNHGKKISSFQAFAVSLSSRVGTGNLAGVASAIFIGGPGAVFWMWIMALLGSATAFMESTLAQLYKRKGEDAFYGGPAYYMQYGMGKRWMGIVFAIFMIYGFGLANQIVQCNTICGALNHAMGIEESHIAWALMLATTLIIIGGIQRIARFSAIIVPIMAVGYLIFALYIIAVNYDRIPAMLSLIFQSAIGAKPVAGGLFGAVIMQGVKRGLFSNEAGEGSAPNAAATATISHPVKQGLMQSVGVYVDTLLICTCTAFIIILSGLYTGNDDGIVLTAKAMDFHVGQFGAIYLTVSIFLFAYSTVVANYFYGESNVRFITDKKWAIRVFQCLTAGVVLISGYVTLGEAFCLVDLAMALMVILNLIAVVALSRHAFRLLNEYQEQIREGKDPSFSKTTMPDIQDKLEGWR